MPTWTPAIQRINDLGIDCTYRQFDYWSRLGYLGEQLAATPGSGYRRDLTSTDLEALHAVNEIRKISARVDLMRTCEVVRARPVSEAGEILVVDGDGSARRFDHWCARPDDLEHAAAVVPLRSFAAVAPAGDGTGCSPAGRSQDKGTIA